MMPKDYRKIILFFLKRNKDSVRGTEIDKRRKLSYELDKNNKNMGEYETKEEEFTIVNPIVSEGLLDTFEMSYLASNEDFTDDELESNLKLIGIVGIGDRLRPGVKEAI